MRNKNRSLHVGLVIRYTVFFIIANIAIIATVLAFLGYYFESMTDNGSIPIANPLTFSGTLVDGDLELSSTTEKIVWIDFLREGEVIKSIGERDITQTAFTSDTLNQMMTSIFYSPRELGYHTKLIFYPFDHETDDIAILYTSIDTSVQVGISVPEEFKGTAIEKQLNDNLNRVYFLILGAVALVIAFFSIITYRMIIKPIEALNKGLLAVHHGELSTRIQYKGYRELMVLTESFNRMTARLENAEHEAAALSESKRSMILHLSHDLRTPSTVINGYSKALLEGKVPEERKLKYYAYLVEKSTLLVSRIEQLFAYAKLDLSQYDLNKQRVEMCEFLRVLVIHYLEELEAAHHPLEMEVPDEELWCLIDKIEMERAIGNLIENAIKYSGEGATVGIKLCPFESDASCEITVEDNGIGLGLGGTAVDTESFFEPFVRGDLSRNTRGTGLGLAITRQIVRLHGGDVTCEVLDPGVRFKITIGASGDLRF